MLVLGIETSTAVTSLALYDARGPVGGAWHAGARRHVEYLLPSIQEVLADAGRGMNDLTGIAVGLGPGLFTGMRVGVATAKTLAQALRIPIVGIPSLDVLAFPVRFTPKVICACVDARRGQVFAACYRAVPGGVQREGDYQAWDPPALAAELAARGDEILFVGDGAATYPDLRDAGEIARGGIDHPRAEALVELALPRFEREDFSAVAQVEPLYVRRSDAEIKWEERGVVIERPSRVRTRRTS